jgi:hypothetical protein
VKTDGTANNKAIQHCVEGTRKARLSNCQFGVASLLGRLAAQSGADVIDITLLRPDPRSLTGECFGGAGPPNTPRRSRWLAPVGRLADLSQLKATWNFSLICAGEYIVVRDRPQGLAGFSRLVVLSERGA